MKAIPRSIILFALCLGTAYLSPSQERPTLTTTSRTLMGIPLVYTVTNDRLELSGQASSSFLVDYWMPFRPDGRSLAPQTGIALVDQPGMIFAVISSKTMREKPLAVDSFLRLKFIDKDGNEVRASDKYIPVTNFHYDPEYKHWAVALAEIKKLVPVIIVYDGKEVKRLEPPLASKGAVMDSVYEMNNGALLTTGFQWEQVSDQSLRQMPVMGMTLSPDGTRLAYIVDTGKSRDGCYVVLDGQEGPRFSGINAQSLVFSPDSRHLAYVASKKWDAETGSLVLDGQVVSPENIERKAPADIRFSSDGRFLIVAVRQPVGIPWTHRIFDVQQGQFLNNGEDVQDYCLRSDGKPPLLTVKAQSGAYKVVGGEFGEKIIGKKGQLFSSPDNSRFAWVETMDSQQAAVIDTVAQTPYPEVGWVIFSPDSKRFAYRAKNQQKKWILVVDGAEWGAYEEMGPFPYNPYCYPTHPYIFSPDSRRAAVTVRLGDKYALVIDGKAELSYSKMGAPVFSPDGRRIAVWASDGKKEFIVVDGREMPKFDEVDKWQLIFSPDGRHVAYKAKTGKKWFLALDETVSANGFDVIVTAHKDRTSFVFTGPEALYYVGLKDNRLYLVEEKIGPGSGQVSLMYLNEITTGKIRHPLGVG